MTKAYIPPSLSSDDRKIVYSVFTMNMLADLLIPFQAAKDREYDSHWASEGLMGYEHGCILRQTMRIKPGIENLIAACDFDPSGNIIPNQQLTLAAASLMDTLVDTAIYALLGVCLVGGKFPAAGEAYKRKVLHRVMHGLDMADTDLDLYENKEDVSELAADLAKRYRAKLEEMNIVADGQLPQRTR